MKLKGQLRFYMEKTGLSISKIASKTKIPKSSLADWVSGAHPRDIGQVKRLSNFFNTSLDNLLFGTGEETVEETKDLDDLLGDNWITGLFEIKLRRVSRRKKQNE